MDAAESGKHLITREVEEHWCDLVGCDRVCKCGATCEDHMEDRTPCPVFDEDEADLVTGVRKVVVA